MRTARDAKLVLGESRDRSPMAQYLRCEMARPPTKSMSSLFTGSKNIPLIVKSRASRLLPAMKDDRVRPAPVAVAHVRAERRDFDREPFAVVPAGR